MGQIKASQIEGLEKYGSGLTWWPNIPVISPIAVNAGSVNDITTLGVVKQNHLKDLEFKSPIDYQYNSEYRLAGKYYVTNQLNTTKTFVLREKDTTYPFAVLVYYDYLHDQIGILQGDPESDNIGVPTLPNGCISIGVHLEPKQGDEYVAPVQSNPKYFKTKAISYTSGNSLTLDYQYSQIDIICTGTFTLTINPPTNWVADSENDPTGKTMIVRIQTISGTPTIVWNGFKSSDSTLTFVTTAGKVNVFTVMHRNYQAVNQFFIDNIIYTV